MRSSSLFLTASLLLACAVPSQAARIRRGPTSSKHKTPTSKNAPHQRAIDDGRATEIQNALVKSGYLPSASGHWDAASQAAMQKMQSDNGWQTKIVPDSRALIKLGLGPSASAATGPQAASGAAPAETPQQGSR